LGWNSRTEKLDTWAYWGGTVELKILHICTYWYGRVELEIVYICTDSYGTVELKSWILGPFGMEQKN
jgi:hypothetical protein